jgi:DNA-directed RNA polymerase specialized sigma24 family protein
MDKKIRLKNLFTEAKSDIDLSLCSDKELLGFLTQSNKAAFSMIFDRYGPSLYAYIITFVRIRTTGEQARNDTAHMLIDIFNQLWNDREKLVIVRTLNYHLYSTAHNKAISYVVYGKESAADVLI